MPRNCYSFQLILKLFFIVMPIICSSVYENKPIHLNLAISSKLHRLELSWYNVQPENGMIFITDQDPGGGDFRRIEISELLPMPSFQESNVNSTTTTTTEAYTFFGILPEDQIDYEQIEGVEAKNSKWIYGLDNRSVIFSIEPDEPSRWLTTKIAFDMNSDKNITIDSKCYAYWATYVSDDGEILAKTCIRAHPKWMNEMRSHIENFKFRDLFIAGTHDSGSYRKDFDPIRNETLVSKYSLTQDDDIRGQLMHGVRYLDIRIGYYRNTVPKFWVNHGISRQQPLFGILQQVRDFVEETNELIIFDIQEFPVGFGKSLDIHRQLVEYIKDEIGDLMADPNLTWEATLNDLWKGEKNVIVAYDYYSIVEEFPTVLWHSVQQRWGNVQSLADLKRHLSPTSRHFYIFSSRPIADMAELTPNTWDVITDRFGGLRRLADQTNRHISKWYLDEWGPNANIVAVDFVRGTNIMEASLYWNAKKDNLRR